MPETSAPASEPPPIIPAPEFPASRRRRRKEVFSTRRLVYDRTVLGLLLGPLLAGLVLFGAVRPWSAGGLMFCTFVALLLFCLRPFIAPDLRGLQLPPGSALIALGLGYAWLAGSWSVVPWESRLDALKLTSLAAACWIWTDLGARNGRWRFVYAVLIFAVALVAWYALIQHFHHSRMVLNLPRPAQYGLRASGTYMCPNHFANLLEMLVCLALALLFMPSAGWPLRLLAGYGLLMFLPNIFLSQSRSGWIGTALGVTVTCWMIAWKRSRRLFWCALVVLPLGVVALAVGLYVASPMVKTRVDQARAGDIRQRIWPDTLKVVAARPLLGHGPGTYRWTFFQYKSTDFQLWVNYAHNEYLQILAEYGVAGLAIFALLAIYWLVRLLLAFHRSDRERDPLLIAGLVGGGLANLAHAVFDFNFHVLANMDAFALLAGVTFAALHENGLLRARPLPRPGWAVVFGSGLALAALWAWMALRVGAADALLKVGEVHRMMQQDARALSSLHWARRLDPGNWQPCLQLGHVYKTRAAWQVRPAARSAAAGDALAWYAQALARNPLDTEIYLGQSRAYAAQGDDAGALQALRAAVDLAPTDVLLLTQLGLRLRLTGDLPAARAVFARAAALDPGREAVQLNLQLLEPRPGAP